MPPLEGTILFMPTTLPASASPARARWFAFRRDLERFPRSSTSGGRPGGPIPPRIRPGST
jgi:hypothetical protein